MLPYLARRLVLEKGYAVWGTRAADGSLRPKGLAADQLPAGGLLCDFPELVHLDADFDVLLVRCDGLGFHIAGLRAARPDTAPDPLRERLLRVGESCQRYTGSVNGSKVPVEITVWELFERSVEPADRDRLRSIRRRALGSKVFVSVLALDPITNTAWSNLPPFIRWPKIAHASRLLRERGLSEEELQALLAQAGVRLLPILLGVTTGAATAFAARFGLAHLGVTQGTVYSGSDLIIGLLVTVFAVLARHIRRNSVPQALLAASAYHLILCGGLLALGAEFSLTMVLNLAILIAIAFLIGSASEMA